MFPHNGGHLIFQSPTRAAQSPLQPPNLRQTLLQAVKAGRRRGVGRRGRCAGCGVSLAQHFDQAGRFQSCLELTNQG